LLLILSIIPVKGNLFGGVMMTFYGIGHCILILVVGTSAGAARHILSSKRIHGANSLVKKSAGALLTILGVYILFGEIAPKFGLIL
jgi:hypothetical protein